MQKPTKQAKLVLLLAVWWNTWYPNAETERTTYVLKLKPLILLIYIFLK